MDSTLLSFAGQSNKWNTADDAAAVVDAIKQHKNLKILDLENNTLGPDAAKVIGDALASHPEFERARFKDLFTGRLKTEIPLALKYLFSGIVKAGAKIVELDLSDNALGPVGVEGMVDFMSSASCYTLQELRLNNNGLGITGGTMLAKSLEALIENSAKNGHPWQLKVFIAGRNRLEKVGAKVYAQIFKRLGSLEELAMPQNGIFHEGIAALAEAIAHNPKLRVLNLNDNTFTRKGAEAMAKHLPCVPHLEVINFGDCLLRNAGAQALARVLMQGHEGLRELNFDGNELTTQGALSVAEALQNKPHLTKLQLDDNMLGDEGKDLIITFLDDIGKKDVLQPLENNLDPDSEEEEAEDDDEEESEESSEDEESEVEIVHQSVGLKQKEIKKLDSSVIEGPVEATASTAVEYVLEPTASRLLGLTNDWASLPAVAVSGCRTPDQEITSLMKLLVKTSALAHTTDHKLMATVKDTVKALGAVIFTKATNHLLVSFTTNLLLVYLGLIKCEDKDFSVTWEQRGVLLSLVSLVNEDFFPRDTKNTLNYFLSRQESTKLDALPMEKKQLVEALTIR